MSERVRLTANDGHELEAYVARPEGDPIAGLVVVQEIFGINAHIRSVADGYAKDGFLVVAPALFDRYERGVELGYEGEDMQKAMSFAKRIDIDAAVRDTGGALDYLRNETGQKCGVIGYCLGGTIAWLAATRLKADAAVGYYGGRIAMYAAEQPQAPVMLHFGKKDQHIPK
jgi:carboxymethylenebutenolidase